MTAGLALVLAFALQAEETVSYGNVVVRVPAGWSHEKKSEGLFLRPGDLKEDEAFIVIVPPGGRAEGTLTEGLEKSWKQVAGQKKIVKKAPGREMKTEGGADGLMSVGLMETPDGIRVITSVAVFKCGDRTEAVLALTAQDHVFQRYTEPLGTLLKGLRFKNVELPVYELFLSMGYTDKAGKTTVHVLFKDGTLLSTLPGEGLDDLDASGAKKRFEAACGTHEAKDGMLTLRLGGQTETVKLQADGSYRSAEGGPFQRVPPSTGLRFEGRYHLHGGTGAPGTQALVFKADGSFEDLGGSSALLDPSEARTKTGAYEILNNTMWLTFADARNRKVSFVLLPKAGEKNPEFILLNSQWFKRE